MSSSYLIQTLPLAWFGLSLLAFFDLIDCVVSVQTVCKAWRRAVVEIGTGTGIGTRPSEAEPEAGVRPPGGDRRRRTAGGAKERARVSAPVPHPPATSQGRADPAQRGAVS